MMTILKIMFGGNGWIIFIVATLLALVAFASSQRSIGAAKAISKIETDNAHATINAHEAATRSLDPGSSGVLDPYLRAD